MNLNEKELWDEAQKAYRRKDQETLRTILLRIEGGGVVDVASLTSIGALRDVIVRLHFEYREIHYFKSREKKEHAYRFWASKKRPKNRMKVEAEIRNEITQQMHFCRHEMRNLKLALKSVARSRN